MNRYKLVVFDMDDILISSGSTWIHAELKLYAHLGHTYSAEAASGYKGMNAMDVGRSIWRYCHPDGITEDECGQMLRGWLLEEFRGTLNPMPGADTLLSSLHGRIDMMVASGSPAEGIRTVLDRLGWNRHFKQIISSEEVAKGKPAPDVFFEAAKRMCRTPSEALVIEDSLHGLRAAQNAGMDCIIIPRPDDLVIHSEAPHMFPRLDEIPLGLVLGNG